MTKYVTLSALVSIIVMTACGNDSNNTTQVQIDSAANARTAAMEVQLKTKNDSLINAMALRKADSSMMMDSIAQVKAATAHPGTQIMRPTPPAKPADHPVPGNH